MPRVESAGDVWEIARRIRAAMAYSRTERKEIKDALNVSLSTVDWMIGTRRSGTPSGASHQQMDVIADVCGLPRDWFKFDIDKLDQIPLPGTLISRPGVTERELRRRRALRSLEPSDEEDPHRDEEPQPPEEPDDSEETDPEAP